MTNTKNTTHTVGTVLKFIRKIVEIEAKWIIQVSLSGQQNEWSCTRLLGSTNRTLFLRFLD